MSVEEYRGGSVEKIRDGRWYWTVVGAYGYELSEADARAAIDRVLNAALVLLRREGSVFEVLGDVPPANR